MTPSIKNIKVRKAARALVHLGFILESTRGSHRVYRHPDGRQAVLPGKDSDTVKVGTICGILNDIGISKDDFLRLI